MRRSTVEPRDAVRERETAARLRQRLWGAAVLIALAVIGLPLLLDGSGSESRFRRVERLREEPPRIVATESAAARQAGATTRTASEPVIASAPVTADGGERDHPRDDAGGARQPLRAWVVQAGSFLEQGNAIAVRDRLRRAGFPSFVSDTSARRDAASRAPVPRRPGPLFRVQVGPMVERARADETRAAVVELLGREAIVVAYP